MDPVKCAGSIIRTEQSKQSLIKYLQEYPEPLEGCVLLCLQPDWTFDMVQECLSDEAALVIVTAAAKVISMREACYDAE